MKKTVIVAMSIREFGLPAPRLGDIHLHSGYGPASELGIEVHQHLQVENATENPNYVAEMRLTCEFHRPGYRFIVSGRADGVFEGSQPKIQEIKSTFDTTGLIETLKKDPCHPYWLQLMLYQEFYRRKNAILPTGELMIVSLRNRERFCLPLEWDQHLFDAWLNRRLAFAIEEAKDRQKCEKRRQKAAQNFRFPFTDVRPGQTELMSAVDQAVRSQQALLVQAPTGMGKTLGVLYPAAQEAFERGQRLIYVTPKNSQHAIGAHAFSLLNQKGARFKTLTLHAKSKLCMKPEPVCNPDLCEYARSHYTKMHEHQVVAKALKKKQLSPKSIRELAETYQVCPFELATETLERVDAVICDYNYVFSPRGLLGRLTDANATVKGKSNLVVDEFHNLPSRACDYFSSSLTTADLEQWREQISLLPPRICERGQSIIDGLLGYIADLQLQTRGEGVVQLKLSDFQAFEAQTQELLSEYLERSLDVGRQDPVVALHREVSQFSATILSMTDSYFATLRRDRFKKIILKITCCDASENLSRIYDAFSSVVGFSATVKPFQYYTTLGGMSPQTQIAEFSSPFQKERRKILIIPQISTKWSDRQTNAAKIAEAIHKIASRRLGNYFAFFPSFEFMNQVADLMPASSFHCIRQKRDLKITEVEAILQDLREQQKPTLFFAVQGGAFAEGVDYPGDMIIGAFIVGPGLPTFDFEREQLREYYQKIYGSGFEYAYTYPAMTRVIQSAGRVIRTRQDKGLIVLMDRRFTQDSFTQSMPKDWFDESVQELVSQEILKSVDQFWSEDDAPV